MISLLVSVLRPICVIATILLAGVLILCFWGWQVVTWDVFWKLFFSYLALMIASTVICYIDDPGRISGRR